ncbi:MAG TPA: glycerophosphodiester phosphodiesterase family protein [Pyrinomonadaceae bacterium]|nr:glycerophosphodiester phosphodiesterase family protein [Pyrinomonadaceae bacterium]
MSRTPPPLTGAPSDGLPLIIGHRGDSAHAPENTMAAFGLALEAGADGVEFDVRLARDGAPVVIHDRTLERTALRPGFVEEMTSEELAGVRVGEWFNRRFTDCARPDFAREHVPTLTELFERFGRSFKTLYVEMKGEDGARLARLAAAVVAAVREHSLESSAVVKCFAHEAIAEVKRLAPEIRTAALFERSLARPVVPAARIVRQALACGADEVSLHHTLARRAVVEAARARGLGVVVWTVDSPAWLARARSYGLRAVITNDPALMRAASLSR